MKHLSVNNYVEIIENSIPKIMKGIRATIPKQALGMKLTFHQGLTLVCLGERDSCKMTELSKETGINLTALTGVVDSLVKDKFVKRERTSKDRRVVLVNLTSSGRKLVNEMRKWSIYFIRRIQKTDNESQPGIFNG